MLQEPRVPAAAEVASDTAKATAETIETTTSTATTAVELPAAEVDVAVSTSTAEVTTTSAETETEEAICFGCGLGFKVPEFGFLSFGAPFFSFFFSPR